MAKVRGAPTLQPMPDSSGWHVHLISNGGSSHPLRSQRLDLFIPLRSVRPDEYVEPVVLRPFHPLVGPAAIVVMSWPVLPSEVLSERSPAALKHMPKDSSLHANDHSLVWLGELHTSWPRHIRDPPSRLTISIEGCFFNQAETVSTERSGSRSMGWLRRRLTDERSVAQSAPTRPVVKANDSRLRYRWLPRATNQAQDSIAASADT
jgi:hypothetical protein